MPKQKTKKAVVKRMKLTKSGKVKRNHAFTSHLLSRRSRKRKRHLRKAALVAGKFEANMRKCLGEG
jgi:large subunit ribosomal protein L35